MGIALPLLTGLSVSRCWNLEMTSDLTEVADQPKDHSLVPVAK